MMTEKLYRAHLDEGVYANFTLRGGYLKLESPSDSDSVRPHMIYLNRRMFASLQTFIALTGQEEWRVLVENPIRIINGASREEIDEMIESDQDIEVIK